MKHVQSNGGLVVGEGGARPTKESLSCEVRETVCYTMRIGQKISFPHTHTHTHLLLFSLVSARNEQLRCCAVIPLLSHVVPVKLRYLLPWDQSLCRVLLELHVPSKQASCHNCFQLAIILKFMVPKILLQRWREVVITRPKIWYKHSHCRVSSYEIKFIFLHISCMWWSQVIKLRTV